MAERKAPSFPKEIKSLPIFPYHGKIKESFDKPSVVTVITAPTGTGKTTFITVDRALHNKSQTALIAVPTIPAVHTIHGFCSRVIKDTDRKVIGYACGGTKKYKEQHSVAVVTHQHAFNTLCKSLNKCIKEDTTKYLDNRFVLIDEAHDRSRENYKLLALCLYLLNRNFKIKLAISSATMNSAPLIEEFKNKEVINIDVNSYSVTIRYAYNTTLRRSARELQQDILMTIRQQAAVNKPGKVGLVFVSGEQMIYPLIKELSRDPDIVALPAHSTLGSEDIDAIFEEHPTKKKVIIGTNMLESAITIPNVVFIIDSMFEKVQLFIAGSRMSNLKERHISQSSADQRKGRTGRTEPGTCIRMCSRYFFDSLPVAHKNDFHTTPHQVSMIELLKLSLPVQDIFRFTDEEYKINMKLLTDQNLIDEKNNVTKFGNSVVDYPVSLENGICIHYARYINCADCKEKKKKCAKCEAATILTVLACSMFEGTRNNSCYFYPRNEDHELHKEEKFEKFARTDDLETMLTIMVTMMFEAYELTDRSYGGWCGANSFHKKSMINCLKIFRQVISRLYDIDTNEVDATIFNKRLKPKFLFSEEKLPDTVMIDQDVMDTIRRTVLRAYPERFEYFYGTWQYKSTRFRIHSKDSNCTMLTNTPPKHIGALGMAQFESRDGVLYCLSWVIKDPELDVPIPTIEGAEPIPEAPELTDAEKLLILQAGLAVLAV
jgi:HrpA-like RNA helicase